MSKSKYQRFGKYLILDHLVDGGMAKICRANYLGEQANKIVAIKMVQPQYSKDPSFVQMFEDELRVTFALVHPNIAQVYDYGLVDNQLYSAMEYVDGANLKQYLDRLKQMKFVFPVEITTYITSQVCQALFYAHTYKDKLSGKSFNIIHRDISPHNIMLTYDGSVKVIDFGIAKADSNAEATQAGTIKGKLSYIAPEYLDGMELDHRYDQFAVGITLWELLCSRKLFTAKNDLAVLKLIQACKIPKPSSINPNVPPELDDIVMKALSKDRNQRYENMDKFNRALIKFLYSTYPDFNNTDLSYFAHQLFKKEIDEDKKKFVDFGKIDISPYLEEIRNFESNSNQDTTVESKVKKVLPEKDIQRTGKIELDLGKFDDKGTALDLDFSDSTVVHTKIKGLASKQLAKEKRKETSVSGKKLATNKTAQTRVKSSSKTKKLSKVEEKEKNVGASLLPTLAIAGLALFTIIKPDTVGDLIGVDLKGMLSGNKTASSEVIKKVENKNKRDIGSEAVGELSFDGYEANMNIYINGVKTELDLLSIYLTIGKSHKLSIGKQGYKKWHYPDDLIFTENNKFIRIQIPELEKERVGFLSTSENFSPGSRIKINIDGDLLEKSLPLKNERIPAGTYNATISNSLLGTERKIRFEIKENKRNFIK